MFIRICFASFLHQECKTGTYSKAGAIVQNRNFMQDKDVLECMNVLNNKKCEGFYRISVRLLAAAKLFKHVNLIHTLNLKYFEEGKITVLPHE